MKEQKFSCPNCGVDILFDVYALLHGKTFVCTGCSAKVQLANESKEEVTETISKFERLKRTVFKNKVK